MRLAVVADLVARARADLAARRKVQGESAKGGRNNLFADLIRCGTCGRRGFMSTSFSKKLQRPYAYLRCEAAQENRCDKYFQ